MEGGENPRERWSLAEALRAEGFPAREGAASEVVVVDVHPRGSDIPGAPLRKIDFK